MEDKKPIVLESRSDELEEIITSIPNWIIRYGNSLVLVIVLLLLLFSYLIKYPEKVKAQVTISTIDPPQKIVTQISGTIDSVFVRNNTIITSNDPIAIFKNAANYRDVLYLQDIISKMDVDADSINFSTEGLPTLLLGELEESFSRFENALISYSLLKKYKDYDIRSVANLQNTLERERKLSSFKAQYQLNSKELKLMQLDVERSAQLYQKGVISRQEHEQKEIEYVRSKKSAKNTLLDISELHYEMTLLEQNLQLNTIEKIRAEENSRNELFQNLDKLKVKIRDWEQKYVLRSARNGSVTFLRDLKKNDYLEEAQFVISVVPTDDLKPIARLKTEIRNSGRVEIGQQVLMKLDNYPYIEYGLLLGTVSTISLVADADHFYFIEVTLNNELVTSYNKQLDFKHELVGQAEIVTQDLRLIERVFNEFRNLVNN